jgi:hypothetical protein
MGKSSSSARKDVGKVKAARATAKHLHRRNEKPGALFWTSTELEPSLRFGKLTIVSDDGNSRIVITGGAAEQGPPAVCELLAYALSRMQQVIEQESAARG